MRSYRCIGDGEATYKVGMNGFFKGFGSVVIGGFVGSCLAAASFLAIEALIPKSSEAHPPGANPPACPRPPGSGVGSSSQPSARSQQASLGLGCRPQATA
ncbi:hypothetical protein SynA15127_02198 [Synechococcus sp. A15-127]|nr:hypothetical protein SynA15127_02198 [Synechococcus sp. A15-127]